MSHSKRERLENPIQREIELALGAEPDLLLLRNTVGVAVYHGEDGRKRVTRYGLGVGSPDLVGILAPHGRIVGFEVKAPGEDPRPEQEQCHAIWRRFGAFIETVTSVHEARTALDRARDGTEPAVEFTGDEEVPW